MLPNPTLPLSLAVAAALALAAPAAADTYVAPFGDDARSCKALLLPCKTVQRGVDAADPGDTVRVQKGTYAESVVADKPVTIAGAGGGVLGAPAGPDATVIEAPGEAPALNLRAGGAVRDIRLVGPADSQEFFFSAGLALTADGAGTVVDYDVRDAVLVGRFGPALYGSGLNGGRMRLQLTGAKLGRTEDKGGRLFTFWSAGVVRSTGLTVDPNGGIGWVNGDTDAAFDGVTSIDPLMYEGFQVESGARLALSRARVHTQTAAISQVTPPGAGTTRVEVRDSLLTSDGAAPYPDAIHMDAAANQNPRNELLLSGSTVVTRGGDGAAVRSTAARSGSSLVRLENSILRAAAGPELTMESKEGAAVQVEATHSAYARAIAEGGASVPAPGTGTNFAGDPGFAGDDYTLAASSPLIDAGDPARAGATDVAGTPRPLDGDGRCGAQPDVGAYERIAAPDNGCPQPPATPAADTAAPALSRLGASKRRFRAGKGTRLRLTLTEAARIDLTVARRVQRGRKRVWRTLGVAAFAAPAGASEHRFSGHLAGRKLRRGRYRLRFTAVDAAGNRSPARTLTLRITNKKGA